jgi:uncharacterized protein
MTNERPPDWARPVVHWSLAAKDPAKQRAFYAELFHWDIADGFIMPIAPGLGAPDPGPAGHIQPGDTPGFALYVQVRDLAETLARTVELGGEVKGDPFDPPGGGPTLCPIADPEGNPLMLVQQ